jgi:hypothetical protein
MDHHDHDEEAESLGTVSSELTSTSPVSSAVSQSCTTTSVKALSLQLVQEVQCMKPGSMKRIDNTPGLALGAAVFPYLQTPAANALVAAQKARRVTLSINSGLRALPQQYLLYRWYQTGRCGIALAAPPGTSNHESGIAVDISNDSSWRSAMSSKGFRWLGSSDAVHFDYRAGGTVSMKGLSVQAFQRLWNRNNPNDKIAEDGSYGPATEARLAKAPVGGFAKGAICTQNRSAPMDDAPGSFEPTTGSDDDFTATPDATEPSEDVPPGAGESGAPENTPVTPSADGAQGCAVALSGASRSRDIGGTAGLALAFVGAGLALRRRRRARSLTLP